VIGERVLLDGTRAPIELHAEPGAQLTIGDDTIVEGGTSIEATLAVSIGARAHIGMYCKIMDNHFHALAERDARPPARAVVVDEDVELGPHVILMAGAHVGRGAVVEASTVVGRPIEPYAVARGNPARTSGHGGINAR
jgi:acetyltransferase-like isoleucine patch superfamily enzyme